MEDENINIGRLLSQILSKWKIYVPVSIICMLAAIIFILITPKEYMFTARMQLKNDSQGMMSELKMLKSSGLSSLLGASKSGIVVEDEIALILSRRNLSEVIKKTNLQLSNRKSKGFKKVLLYGEEVPVEYILPSDFLETITKPITINLSVNEDKKVTISIKSKSLENYIKLKDQVFPIKLKTTLGTFYINENYNTKQKTPYKIETIITPLQEVYEDLIDELYVGAIENISDITELFIEWEHPVQGRDILNSLMIVYNDYSRRTKVSEAEINAKFVREKLDTISTELSILEQQVEQYKKDNEIPDLFLYGEAIMTGFELVEENTLETQTRLRMLDYVIEYLNHPDNEYSSVPLVDGTGEKAIETYNKLILERLRLLQASEQENPAVLLINEQLAEQRKILIGSIKAAREGVSIALNELNKKSRHYSNIFHKLPTQEREFIEIKRQQKIKESMFLFLMSKLQEKELANSPDEQAARIIDYAFQSAKAVYPKKIVILLIAIIFAGVLSIVIISIRTSLLRKK